MDDLGIWVMEFNDTILLDKFWMRARKLYFDRQFPGIAFIKTMAGVLGNTPGKLEFFGPLQGDETFMKECGDDLVKKMKYFNESGNMEFKIKKQIAPKVMITIRVPTHPV